MSNLRQCGAPALRKARSPSIVSPTTSPVFAIHVVPSDLLRGAQIVARELQTRLDNEKERHVLLTVFDSPSAVLSTAATLGVASGNLRRRGFDPRAVLALRRTIHQLRPRVLVAHGSESLKYSALAASDVPIVYYRVGTSIAAARHGWRSRLQRWLAGRAALVVAISSEAKNEVIGLLGVAPSRVIVIPNGRDPAIYKPNLSRSRDGLTRLIFVGHLGESKQPMAFVDLVADLRAQGLHFEAAIAGDGPLRGELESVTSTFIDVLGPRDDIAAVMGDADVLVFTSRPEGEGLPGVLVEAAMVGLPVVTTSVPGSRDVVVDGVTGYVVPVDDKSALREAVERLVRDPDLRLTMGRAAHERAVARFDIDSVAGEWRSALARVVAERAPLRES